MGYWSKRKLHFSSDYFINEKEDLVISEPKVNEILFSPDNYDTADAMWEDIADLQRTLLRNNQIMRVRQEEEDIIVEYVHDNNIKWYGGTNLEFLTEDELDLIESMRGEDCDTLNTLLKCGESEEDKETDN